MLVFLFTDIEGSSKLWEEHTEAMTPVIARHDEILREQVEAAGGRITKHTGDGITAVFDGGQPVACALEAQKRFSAEPWGEIGELRIRAGLHAGEAEFHPSAGTPEGDYFGPPVNATARVMSAAWGGQVLLTPEVTGTSPLPPHATLLDLGEHLLKNVSAPQQLLQLVHPQLSPQQFPPPRTLSGQSIRDAVDERGREMAGLDPQAMGVALVAATLLPSLQGELDPESGALEGNLGILDDLGAGALRQFTAQFAEGLQARRAAGESLGAVELQTLLHGELMARWQAGGETAVALRSDASRLLQAVDGVQATMAASTAEVKEALAQGLADLGGQFGEFRWMLAGLGEVLAEMRARQALGLALQREQLDLQRQQLVKTNLILHRQQAGAPVAQLTVSGEVDEPPPADVVCPYKGLAAFEADDAEYFFGREELVAELSARLAETRFLAVVGPSGSGKSSVVRAGLLPAVWAGALPDSENWPTLVLTPGGRPLNELAVRLAMLGDERPGAVLRDLEADPRVLELTVRRVLAEQAASTKLLLVVDQFEEIFALCHDEEERQQFIEALLYAVEAEGGRTVVVPTIRADFYGRCAGYPQLAAHMSDGLLVGPMNEEELLAAIERPAAVVGLRLEPGLAEMILDDVAGEPGALPLMSHALLETFARRGGAQLTLSGYAASGGVAGAIAQTADTVYGGMNADEQALARSIFMRLTELGEEGAQDTRRRVAPSELVRREAEAPEVEALLRTLAAARLVTTGGGPLLPVLSPAEGAVLSSAEGAVLSSAEGAVLSSAEGAVLSPAEGPVASAAEGSPAEGAVLSSAEGAAPSMSEGTVEVAHEALIREWPALRSWLEEDREGLRVHRHLTEAAQEWERLGREPGELYRGARLAAAGEWVLQRGEVLNPQEREFLAASRELAEREEAEREAQRQRELEAARALAAEQEKRAEEQAESAGRLRRRALLLAGAMGVAVILAVVAFFAFRQATQNASAAQVASTQAVSERYMAETAQVLEADQRATAEAEGWARATQQAVAEAESQARATQQAIAETEAEARATQQAIAEEQRAVAEDQTRLATSRELAAAAVSSLEEDPERSTLLALEALGAADTLEARNALHQALPEIRILRTLPLRTASAAGVAYSPDGSLLAASLWSGESGGVMVWDTASSEELFLLERPLEGMPKVSFSPDGTRLFASTTTDLFGWEITVTDTGAVTATNPFTLTGTMSNTSGMYNVAVGHMSFSPDGTRMAVAHWKGAPTVFDLATMTEVLRLEGHANNCRDVSYSPDGSLLATAGDDLTVRVWDAETSHELLNIETPNIQVYGVDFSPDGTGLVTADEFGVMNVWDPRSGEKLLTVTSDVGSFFGGRYAPDGRTLVTPMADGTVRSWDAESGNLLVTYAGHTGSVFDAVVSPDGTQLASAGSDGTVRIWKTGLVGELGAFSLGPGGLAVGIEYSPDGKHIAVGNLMGLATVWDPVAGELILTLPQVEGAVGTPAVAYSPDGTQLAVGSANGPIHVWNLETLEPVVTLSGHAGVVIELTFSPDGGRLASAGLDGLGAVWDLESGQMITLTQEGQQLFDVTFSPDGSRVTTVSQVTAQEKGVYEWDAATGDLLRMLPVTGTKAVYTARYSPDGEQIAAGIQEGDVLVWETASGELVLKMTGHTGLVGRVAFSPDAKYLMSTSKDDTVKLWDLSTGAEMQTLYGQTGALNWGIYSPDGTRIITTATDGTIRTFVVSTDELVALARSRLSRSLTNEECQKYLHMEECPEAP